MILVYGWGNPIFGDDAVGIQVAKKLETMDLPEDVTIEYSSASPFSVVENFLHHEKVFLIDACKANGKEEGEIRDFTLNGDEDTSEVLTPHSASLISVLKMYKELYPDEFPKEINVYGLCVNDIKLSDDLSEHTQKKSEEIMHLILDKVRDDN